MREGSGGCPPEPSALSAGVVALGWLDVDASVGDPGHGKRRHEETMRHWITSFQLLRVPGLWPAHGVSQVRIGRAACAGRTCCDRADSPRVCRTPRSSVKPGYGNPGAGSCGPRRVHQPCRREASAATKRHPPRWPRRPPTPRVFRKKPTGAIAGRPSQPDGRSGSRRREARSSIRSSIVRLLMLS